MRFSVWQSVKATGDHRRAEKGEAGTVQGVDPAKPDEVVVRWDTDGVMEAVAVDQLQGL